MSGQLQAARRALGRGDYLRAFDLVQAEVEAGEASTELRYVGLLALARSGATRKARDLLARWDMANSVDPTNAALASDILALEPRLNKDVALASGDPDAAALSAAGYGRVHDTYGGTYTAVNAATMWELAGNHDDAARWASRVLELLAVETTEDPGAATSYWHHATAAEAHLVLGDTAACAQALAAAAEDPTTTWAMRAATRLQLRLLASRQDIAPTFLDAIDVPAVLHYCGHLFAGRPVDEEAVRTQVDQHLEELQIGLGFGSLAGGSDIIVAEALLARGAELHVFLPFNQDEFIQQSVAVCGPQWVARFQACLQVADSVRYTTDGRFDDDASLYGYCSQVAMGHARIRATALTSQAHQLAIWDGQQNHRDHGTTADVAHWGSTGGSTMVVAIEPVAGSDAAPTPPRRQVRAFLFSDHKGYGRLADHQLTAFNTEVMGPLAETLDAFSTHILHRNRWGDGLYVVFDDVTSAATCALQLQQTMADMDLTAMGLPEGLRMRVGAHAAPVFEAHDPIAGVQNFFGAHVTTAARVEPGTPEGEVYVTEPFAALVALNAPPRIECQYVGVLATAKDHGRLPLYLLRHT